MKQEKVMASAKEVEIVYDYPPNIAEIIKEFPMAATHKGVVFAYGDKIYAPTLDQTKPFPAEILAHERIHCERQLAIGVELWWQFYIKDYNFRYKEELLAHRVEYSFLRKLYPGKKNKIQVLDHVARKLSNPLYGSMVSLKKAKEDLKDQIC